MKKFEVGSTFYINDQMFTILKEGERSKVDKKGNKIFDCYSYMAVDCNNKLYYFLQGELE